MELNLNKEIKEFLTVFIMIILPLILIGLGAIVFNIVIAWYFILCIVWFSMGIIFYSVIEQ